jgi:hypothetical protein
MIKRLCAMFGALAIVGGAALTVGTAAAGAHEYGNDHYLGTLARSRRAAIR